MPSIYNIAARKLVSLTAVTCWSLGLSAGAVLGPASSQSCYAQASPDDGRQRTTVQAWVGLPGVEETVAQIMARTAEHRQQGINPRPSHRKRLSPPAPANAEPKVGWPTAIWPATGGPAMVAAPPVPESPQTPGANWLAATGGLDTEQSVDVFGLSPPDSMGEIGPNNYVVTISGLVRSFNRAGVKGVLDTSLSEFFASQLAFNEDTGDPQIRYDRLTARWFITAMSINNPNKILVAVSNGDTINVDTVFRFFNFLSDAPNPAPAFTNGFVDYPTMGLDANGLYIGCNAFNAIEEFIGPVIYVVKKSSLIGPANTPIVVSAFRNLPQVDSRVITTPRGVHNDDPTPPSGYVIGSVQTYRNLALFRIENADSNNPVLVAPDIIAVPPFARPNSFTALGTDNGMDGGDERLLQGLVSLNRLTGERTLWTSHGLRTNKDGVSSTSGDRVASRWYQIGLEAPATLIQAGTLFDNANTTTFKNFSFGTVAQNGQGDMAMGSSFGGTADYMGIATAGRLFTDAPGVTQSPDFPVTSTKSYNVIGFADERWGDYSSTRVDPRDDQTFWTIQEYTPYEDAWGVRVIKLVAAGPAIPLSASPSIIPPGRSDVNVVITGSTFGGRGWLETEPGLSQMICNFGAGITVNSITVLTPGQMRLSLTTGAGSVGPRSLTVTNPDGQTASSIGPIIIIDPSADPGPIFPGGPPGFGCAAIVSGPGSGNPVCQGSTVTFSIVASGTPAPQYQWQRNGQNLPGAQLASLTIRGVKSSDGGNYRCIVFNLCGPVISAARTLSVIGNPVIDSQPAGGTFAAGSSVQLTGAFSIANFPVVYWLKDGLEIVADGRITGVYTTTLSIANFNAADAGSYTMTVSAACGTTTSNAAVLAVGAASTCVADVASDSLDTTRNPNGSVGSEDLDAFISAFIADNALIADVASDSLDTTYNPNGVVGPEDLDAFISSFITGCQ